jgi:hypothetical protein
MNNSPQKKANVFEVEWRGKVDILSLKITEKGRFPLKVYNKAAQYLQEACASFNYERGRAKV